MADQNWVTNAVNGDITVVNKRNYKVMVHEVNVANYPRKEQDNHGQKPVMRDKVYIFRAHWRRHLVQENEGRPDAGS